MSTEVSYPYAQNRIAGHGGTQSSAPTTDRPATLIETLASDLIDSHRLLMEFTNRVRSVADRATGGLPTAGQPGNGNPVPPACGVIGNVADTLSAVRHTLDDLRQQVERIERIA